MKIYFLILFFLSTGSIVSQSIDYTLQYEPGADVVKIEISFNDIPSEEVNLIIPRSGPGTYEMTNYLAFVNQVKAYASAGEILDGIVGMGSFFRFEQEGLSINRISYEVDIRKMEEHLLGGFASSKVRENYLGLLGYSVFGFVEGMEREPIQLNISTDPSWPIFSTLRPSLARKVGSEVYVVKDFAELADAQYLFGEDVQLIQVQETEIPLFVAAYAEVAIDPQEIGRKGMVALKGLKENFGYIPMPHYTMVYEFLIPVSDRHDYGFNMEHMNSMTASMDTSRAKMTYDEEAPIGSIVHHMGHSWIPLRSYGKGYRPFEWQSAPVIETIWLNEGFIWYVSMIKILNNDRYLNFFRRVIENAPDFIREKSLQELSRLGSSQYSLDFRIGRNLFSRGALMAKEMDDHIIAKTNGKRSFKDALLGLLHWTKENQRAFEYDEILPIMSEASGVDLSEIWDKWQ